MKFVLVYCSLFLFLSTKLFAQPPHNNIQATKVVGKIKIDGQLNERDWLGAHTIQSFKEVEPYEGTSAQFDTHVKVLFDNENLYIGFFALDSLGKKSIRVQDLSRDFSFEDNDLFGVAIDPYHTKRNAFAFQITPYGTQRDLQAFDDNVFDVDWNALWFAKTKITDSGWYGEIKIPFSSINYPHVDAAKDYSWGINFIRVRRASNEITAYPGFPRSFDTYRMTYTSNLVGLSPAKPTINLKANPYLLRQSNLGKQKGNIGNSNSIKLGGDLIWSLSQHSILNATFNTDFAQADVDRQIINLSRFSINLPERRPFFLENAGIFRTGDNENIEPFFSRRIGLDEAGNAVPIIAGLKYTDRTVKRTIGALYVLQDSHDSVAKSNFSVLRYIKNYGSANNIGVMLTHQYQNPAQSNTTVSINGLNRLGEKWSVKYLLSQSFNDDDKGKKQGIGAYVNVEYNSNKLIFLSSHSLVSANYLPGMGFVSRENTLVNNTGIIPIFRPSWLPRYIRSMQPGVLFSSAQKASNLSNQEAALSIFPLYFYFSNGSLFSVRWQHNWQLLENNFNLAGAVVPKGNYYYKRLRFKFNSDLSKKLAFSNTTEWGNYFDGRLTSITSELKFSPSPYISLVNAYEINQIKDLGIAKSSFNNNLFTTTLRLSFNNHIQLASFYQYNTQQQNTRLNFRFSWQYKALSFVYLIINLNKNDQFETVENNGIIKINFLKQFN